MEVFYELHGSTIAAESRRRAELGPLLTKDSEDNVPLFVTAEDRQLVLNVLLHCADISNPVKPMRIAEKCAVSDLVPKSNLTLSTKQRREE